MEDVTDIFHYDASLRSVGNLPCPRRKEGIGNTLYHKAYYSGRIDEGVSVAEAD